MLEYDLNIYKPSDKKEFIASLRYHEDFSTFISLYHERAAAWVIMTISRYALSAGAFAEVGYSAINAKKNSLLIMSLHEPEVKRKLLI